MYWYFQGKYSNSRGTRTHNEISKLQDIFVISLEEEEVLQGAKIRFSCHHLALTQFGVTGKTALLSMIRI